MRIVDKYAPLPSVSLGYLAHLLEYGAPHLKSETRSLLAELRASLPQVKLDGVTWLWTPGEDPAAGKWRVDPARARLLAPVDPIVWDRRRFELLWGWAYRFEAYTPAARRTMGHYALPLLYGDRAVGWGNATLVDRSRLELHVGFADPAWARDAALGRAVDHDLGLMAEFLQLERSAAVRLKRPRK
jgi:uncharacterized protein YcaQ